MTAENAIVDLAPGAASDTEADDGRLFCYRHPTRETWLRCNRCDQPICGKCSVQTPVGFKCRVCGLVAHDPLSSFTPRQLALGIGVSMVGGAVAGYVGTYIGVFSIFVGFFAGGLVAEALTRVVGYKRGPVMLSILFGGIFLGAALGLGLQYGSYMATVPADYEMVAAIWLQSILPPALIGAGAACFGAYSRLR